MTDVTIIYELVQLHQVHPEEVDTWVSDESQEFTRGSMKYLRIYLAQKQEENDLASDMLGGDIDVYPSERNEQDHKAKYTDYMDPAVNTLDTEGDLNVTEISVVKNLRHQSEIGKLKKAEYL